MGMGSSQARIGLLTSYKARVEYNLMRIAAQKTELSRNADKVSTDYTDALNSKSLKLSYNNGVNYYDLSYTNLMTPCTINANNPTMVTDSRSRVVISDNYLKYAKMISEDGSATGNWDSIRSNVLAQVVGVSEEDIQAYDEGTSTLTAEQKSLIDFYDTLFFAIAQNGWTYNQQVSDSDYLNEMLQNGCYYLTTAEKEKAADGGYDVTFSTDLAVNNTNVFQVNDSAKITKAKAEYEAKQSRINRKETELDEREATLNTELSAIKEMLESIEETKKKNIESTFKIFA